ncbi:CheR-related putative SAM-binding domain protein [Citrifermentans bemidjiense Bem]|uniref:CheR-related putative SAM-binding domain protein n=1 Tax=Citrifermentans bemidjiense (strain ATCC BAA-1014 / DSM 16622 / JCM 12645 / Bem) TaxID=404380 RepID=B5EG73_CITBB|nr:chemotaxis protein CheR [Citrifermentans bemidjiense]ACH40986.1 CheR-related putative SAM-binding domain protein [Citrifermentans bemidjiense Bem]
MQLSFAPTTDGVELQRLLQQLLVPGSLLDVPLARSIDRLARSFARYAASYPLPLWAPGLVTDNEMRNLTEALLPMAEIRPAFDRLLERSCRFSPLLAGCYLHSSACWIDFLQRLQPPLPLANPAVILSGLAEDDQARQRFLFSLMLPHHYGGGFDRYPLQSQWLSAWLKERARSFEGGIRILDSACGSGEGTYQVAELLLEAGYSGRSCEVHGSTLEEIELFAAAHLYFPHDPEREREYRARMAPVLGAADAPRFEFYLDRVGSVPEREPYHLVLCNGLLGGPMLHDDAGLDTAFAGLSQRLLPGGVLLATDRFHAGWRIKVPAEKLCALMEKQGLTPFQVPEGIGGKKRV